MLELERWGWKKSGELRRPFLYEERSDFNPGVLGHPQPIRHVGLFSVRGVTHGVIHPVPGLSRTARTSGGSTDRC